MTKGQRKMGDYKLISFEPTHEMVEAAEEAYMPFGDMDLAIRMAILAAPDVQKEPVAYAVFADNGNIRIWSADPIQAKTLIQEYGDRVRPLYTAPPAPAAKVPEAWQLVPVEPTQEMLDAGYYPSAQGRGSKSVWEAMLSAAPTPAEPECPTHTTEPAESVMGIALRQLGDESRWDEIRDLNAVDHPDVGPHDYYPVGTVLRMPDAAPTPEGGE